MQAFILIHTLSGVFNAAFLDEFYFVTIRIFDKCDDDSAMFHRASLAHYLSAGLFYTFAGLVGIIHFKRNMAVGIANVITCGIPVVRQPEVRKVSSNMPTVRTRTR